MMHMPRADRVIATGVIEPYWTRFISPVDIARHAIDPFIASVRGPGPQVVPTPDPNSIAAAAQQVASHFSNGQSATISVGGQNFTVSINTPAQGGLVGVITQAAQQLANGQAVGIQVGPYKVIVMPNNGTTAMPTNTDPTSGVSTDSNVTATTLPQSGFGDTSSAPGQTTLPTVPAPTGVRPYAWPHQGWQWRQQLITDNNAAYRTMQATNAAQYAPFALQRVADLTQVPIQWAQTEPANALQSRSYAAGQANQNMNRFVPRFAMQPGGTPSPSKFASGGFGCPGIKPV